MISCIDDSVNYFSICVEIFFDDMILIIVVSPSHLPLSGDSLIKEGDRAQQLSLPAPKEAGRESCRYRVAFCYQYLSHIILR